jgi:hypothetical protein
MRSRVVSRARVVWVQSAGVAVTAGDGVAVGAVATGAVSQAEATAITAARTNVQAR